jgi:menaquinol-cytochrome c reductase iron-sulfur subunit
VTHDAQEPNEARVVGRRDVLSTIGFWIATLASAAILGIPSVRFAVGKSLEQAVEHWVPIGAADALKPGDFTSVVYSFRVKDAWREVKKEGLIYVRSAPRGGASDFQALSGVCTHLGCNVRWSKDTSRFACPCHSGVYDSDGAVISGPPPKPLRQLETRVTEDGVLEAQI